MPIPPPLMRNNVNQGKFLALVHSFATSVTSQNILHHNHSKNIKILKFIAVREVYIIINDPATSLAIIT